MLQQFGTPRHIHIRCTVKHTSNYVFTFVSYVTCSTFALERQLLTADRTSFIQHKCDSFSFKCSFIQVSSTCDYKMAILQNSTVTILVTCISNKRTYTLQRAFYFFLHCLGVLISPYPNQEGNKLQWQKILSFIYPIIIITGGILVLFTYTGCPRRNVPDFGRVLLMLNYTDITQNTYVQS